MISSTCTSPSIKYLFTDWLVNLFIGLLTGLPVFAYILTYRPATSHYSYQSTYISTPSPSYLLAYSLRHLSKLAISE